jgi:uncharacterized low-complexity protein
MSKLDIQNAAGVAAVFAGSLTLYQLASASVVFEARDFAGVGAFAQMSEGKCGEGRCAVAKLDSNKDGHVSYAEAKAGGFSDSQCKTWDKNTDGSLDANELRAMHAILDPAQSAAPKSSG